MQLLAETNKPYIIDSLTAPIGISHFWIFSSHMLDFKLEELTYLEETIGPTITVRAQNLEFDIPASWHVLAIDKETYSIDSVPVSATATFGQNAMLFSPEDGNPKMTAMTIIDYKPKASVIHPMIPKAGAMIHPTGPEQIHGKSAFYGIITGPHDLHRWIGGLAIGDILT